MDADQVEVRFIQYCRCLCTVSNNCVHKAMLNIVFTDAHESFFHP